MVYDDTHFLGSIVKIYSSFDLDLNELESLKIYDIALSSDGQTLALACGKNGAILYSVKKKPFT